MAPMIPAPVTAAARAVPAVEPPAEPPAPTPEVGTDFPGCDPVSMTWEEVLTSRRLRGHLEYWSASPPTAWILRDGGTAHESPSVTLTELLTRISQERGSRFGCWGAVYLMECDGEGRPRRVATGDQTVYLHPDVCGPGDLAVVRGENPLPDVVLEVDHTTDVRRNKLPLYEAWGMPEVWVETPDAPSRSRPRGLRPGLTIHRLDDGRYRQAAESLALPGWTAVAIHAALNETRMSPRTVADLIRVGRRLGEREGTAPDDDPQIGLHRQQARDAGRAEGLAQGRTEAVDRERAVLVRLAARKFDVRTAERLTDLAAGIDDPGRLAAAVDLVIECDDAADLLSRLS